MKSHPGTVLHVAPAEAGATLAAFLRGKTAGASWSQVQALVRSRHVLVHGNICTDVARRLKEGEVVKVLEAAAPKPPGPRDVRLVHLDDDVVVVDKPTGVTTTRHHEERSWPARRRQIQPTLEELVPEVIRGHLARGDADRAARRGGKGRQPAPARRRVPPVRAVHRIDRETSGLVVFARNVPAARILAEQFRLHATQRRYLALVVGRLGSGTMRSRLVRDRGDGRRGSVEGDDDGKLAVTHVTPVEHFGDAYTLVECRLETGRTHQIRIQMSESGHPVCGERVYVQTRRGSTGSGSGSKQRGRGIEGQDESHAPRVMLHAAELGFVHPETGAELRFESPLPADMKQVLAALRKRYA